MMIDGAWKNTWCLLMLTLPQMGTLELIKYWNMSTARIRRYEKLGAPIPENYEQTYEILTIELAKRGFMLTDHGTWIRRETK